MSQTPTARQPEPRFQHLRGWTVGVAVSMLMTCLFLQFVNDWFASDIATLEVERSHQPVSNVEIIQNHGHLVMWTRAAVVMAVASVVLWLCWQYEAHANLRALSGRRHLPPAVGVAGWAVPGLNLILGPVAMLDLFAGSDPEEGTVDRAPRWEALLVLAWWGLFVVGAVSVVLTLVHTPTSGASFGQLIERDQALRTAFYVLDAAAGVGIAMLFAIDVRLVGKDARVTYERERQGWTRFGSAQSGSR